MRVMVTGASGFLGRMLVQRLLDIGQLRGESISHLLLVDRDLSGFTNDPRLRMHQGSITDPRLLRRSLADGVDVLFHLASIPGGSAEQDYTLGFQVNLLASLELLDQLRQPRKPPVLVYASSVAIYGDNFSDRVDESAKASPALSYGAHKLIVETQISDLARRGEVDGRALRLPGIVARPAEPNGLRSAFMSDLLHALAAGKPYVCPVSANATAWWMSARCCVDNLLHAAGFQELGSQRVWQLPVLHLSIDQVVVAVGKVTGADRRDLIEYAPDPELEALFGRFPALRAPSARAAGFKNDGTPQAMVRNALHLPTRARRLSAAPSLS